MSLRAVLFTPLLLAAVAAADTTPDRFSSGVWQGAANYDDEGAFSDCTMTAYRLLFAPEGAFAERLAEVAEQFADHPRIMEIVEFIRSAGNRTICVPRQNRVG